MIAQNINLQRNFRKYLLQRHLLEKSNAENLQDFGHTLFQPQFFFDDGDQDINADGDPDLGLDRIVGRAEERLDMQILFEPFEEQLDLPAALVKLGDRQGVEGKIVGQKNPPFVGFGIVITDAAQRHRIILAGARPLCRVMVWSLRRPVDLSTVRETSRA